MQASLSLDDGTFFFTSNFRNQERFELTAYSHASRDRWQTIWERLLDKMIAVLGSKIVVDDFGDLQKPREIPLIDRAPYVRTRLLSSND